jgi:hypothetical protein
VDGAALLRQHLSGLLRGVDPKHLVEGHEVDRERVGLLFVSYLDMMDITVELGKPVHVVPDALRAGMEDVSAVYVLVASHLGNEPGIAVAGNVSPLLYDQYIMSLILQLPGTGRSIDAGTDYQYTHAASLP